MTIAACASARGARARSPVARSPSCVVPCRVCLTGSISSLFSSASRCWWRLSACTRRRTPGRPIGSGDPTARMLGRVSLNPARHVDPIGTIAFPLIALLTRLPLIGWAKPVPVNTRNFRNPRRDYVFVAAAGPAEQPAARGRGRLRLAIHGGRAVRARALRVPRRTGAAVRVAPDRGERSAGGLQHDSRAAPRRRQRSGRSAAVPAVRSSSTGCGRTASSSSTCLCSPARSAASSNPSKGSILSWMV